MGTNPISKKHWTEWLAQSLTRLQPDERPRLAVVGIGHVLRGDDAAGVAVARALQPYAHEHLLVVDAGHAPENHTGPLRRFAPDLVLLVDTAQMNEPPGMVRWLPWQETSGVSASTHTMPPYVIARYLTAELGCEVALIGIQPADTTLGAPLSPAVQQTVYAVAQALISTTSEK
ncbi:MAG TPA: hydrogenase 3 maturation endopeptidase HyCI [Anaerolineae bacterium]